MSEYTKGLWTYGEFGGYFGIKTPDACEPDVLFMPSRDIGDNTVVPTEADANLIIAAPDMYEALKAVLEWHGGRHRTHYENHPIDMASRALAKAIGCLPEEVDVGSVKDVRVGE